MTYMAQVALIISAVTPVPADNGKRVVLAGLVSYLCDRLGPENVHYALVADPADPPPALPCVIHLLKRPRAAAQLTTLAWRCTFNRSYTAQEAMLGSRTLRNQIHGLIRRLQPTIEIYDTLRMGQHSPRRGTSLRVLYLDDLFSLRYARLLDVAADGDADIDPLGEFATNVPRRLRGLVRHPRVYVPLLGFERDRIRRREVEVTARFDASLLVNPDEVEILSHRGGTNVLTLTPLLPLPASPVRRPVSPAEFVFLGRLNIPHNDDAICSFLRTAMTPLEALLPGSRVRIIGKQPSAALRHLVAEHGDHVSLEGFVPDLNEVFARATALIAPLRFGSGVKIKVLEGLARAVPVLATGTAAEGITCQRDGRHGVLIEDDLTRWPGLLVDLADGSRNAALSIAALDFYDRNYDRDAVRVGYDRIFGLKAPRRRTISLPDRDELHRSAEPRRVLR